MTVRHLVVTASLLLATCKGSSHNEPAPRPGLQISPSTPAPSSAPALDANQGSAMATTDVRDKLPTPFDARVTRVLEAPLPEGVVLELDHVAMAKLPYSNYRFQITADGSLYYVQHSGTPGDWQVPFDRPLPDKPSMKLDPATVTEWVAKLEAAGFFDHPGYQANPNVEDGSFWIIRARRGEDVHAVVFQNTKPDYVAAFAAIADPLWKQR